jgi:hypothetical protein
VRPRAGLNSIENRKFFLLLGIEVGFLGRPDRSLVTILSFSNNLFMEFGNKLPSNNYICLKHL